MRAALVSALALLLLGTYRVAANPYARAALTTSTPGQALGLNSRPGSQPRSPYAAPAPAGGAVRDERVTKGHTVQVLAVGNTHQVLVDGRVLATDMDDDRVLIQGVYPANSAGAARRDDKAYVLVAEQSGGTACPSMYQAIELGGAAAISPRFGNCSDTPRVSVRDGGLRVSVPQFRAAPAATYVFQGGRLVRSGPASR